MHVEDLHPGDRILAYTDGITDARSADGEHFGLDRLVDFVNRALNDGLPSPETMRRLVRAVVGYQDDQLRTTRRRSSWSGGRRTCRSRTSVTSRRTATDRTQWDFALAVHLSPVAGAV